MTDRRFAVPFDPEYFARRAAEGESVTPEAAFRHSYTTNHWAGATSASGPGADREQTRVIRERLPLLLRQLGVRTMLDLPCGEAKWMAEVDLDEGWYTGADLLPEVVESAAERNRRTGREFQVLDLLSSHLPTVDLVLCRDCLVHLSFADILRAVENLTRAGIAWLLTTTFPGQAVNSDIQTGDWRPLNLQAPPFSWPEPQGLINEGCTEGNGVFADKSLALWRISTLPRSISTGIVP